MKQNLFLPKTALAFLMVLFSTWGWGQTYNLVTAANQLEAGAEYIIAGTTSANDLFVMSTTQAANNRTATEIDSGVTTMPSTITFQNNYASLILGGATGSWTLYDGNSTGTGTTAGGTANGLGGNVGYLYPITGENYLRTRTATSNWTISISGSSVATIRTSVNNRAIKLNTNSSNGSPLFSAYQDSSNQRNVYLYKKSVPTWDGTQWIGGTPTATTPAIINANYTGGSFTAQSVTVNNGFILNIDANQTVTTGNITNNGAIVVNDGGNLLQTSATSTYTAGTGATFTVNKAYATNVAGKYAFWSSPVQNQNMFNAFTAQPADVTTYNTSTNYYDAVTNFNNNSGKGYSIQMPVGGSASFVGTPNNGDVSVALSNASFGYNLVGNPYPSNLNLPLFLTSNSGNIDPTLYFWDNTSAPVANQTGQTSANYGYATFNASGSGTWASAQTITGGTGNNINLTNAAPQINPGQGFIVKSLTGTSLVFNNGMRTADAGTFVNKNGSNSSEGKYWLKLTTPFSANNTLAVTYGEGATNAFDGFDSKAMALGSDAFYSKVLDNKLAIQGRADFVNTDVVPLGSKHFTDGLHTISLANKTGVFNNGQAIYLHDKVLGTYTNLQNTAYNFTVNAGEITDRFEVVYLLGTLSTVEAQKGSFEIYRDGNDFYARNSKNIDSIEVFDASGRKIQEMNPASQLVRIPLDAKGFYIIKAKSAGKEYSKKITY